MPVNRTTRLGLLCGAAALFVLLVTGLQRALVADGPLLLVVSVALAVAAACLALALPLLERAPRSSRRPDPRTLARISSSLHAQEPDRATLSG